MYDVHSRPCWEDYYMGQAFYVATRSIDTSTKCGCIVVSQDNSPLSQGYNSPPRGCNDSAIPTSRPEKYAYFAHAEENAINNAAREGICLKGSTFYITGFPCSGCFRKIKNVGAKRIVYGPNMAHMHREGGSDTKDFEIVKFMNSDGQVEIVRYRGSPEHALKSALMIWQQASLKER